jgi:phosphomannomutase
MNKFIFDVDGTLTPSRQKIDPSFKEWFTQFCIDNDVYLVTGSDYAKTQEQLGDYLLRWPMVVYGCSGNDVWAKGERIWSNKWEAPNGLYELMHGWLQTSSFPLRTGNHIEERMGTINFSIVGRNCTLGERKMYIEHDISNRERESIALQINMEFPEITAKIGGETGIDIYPKGKDKSQIVKDFSTDDFIMFFGDKMDEGGNDKPLADVLFKSYQGINYHVTDWKHTWEILKGYETE